MATKRLTRPQRGEVWLVSFDPTRGAEIRKTRPALIVQNNIGNRWSSITIVAAISSRFEQPVRPVEVVIRAPEAGLNVDSVVLLNQIRSVDKERLIHRIGAVNAGTMERVDRALLISLGLAAV